MTAEQTFTLDVNDVNQPPMIVPNVPALTLDEDTSLVIDVLSRVVDLDGDALTVSNVSVDASQGIAVLNADHSITFTPTANFNGSVMLSYSVSDGRGGELLVNESITVTPINDAPTVNVPMDAQTSDEGQAFSYTLPTDAFIDVDGDALTYSATLADGSALPSWLVFDSATQTFSAPRALRMRRYCRLR